MTGIRIAINTSCVVAGGAVTHLRQLLPEIARIAGLDTILIIGDREIRERVHPPKELQWIEVSSIRGGLLGRLWFENVKLPRLLTQHAVDVLFHPGNLASFRSPAPQVILIHNLAPFLPEVVSGESLGQKLRLHSLRFLTARSLSVADGAIFISRWGRDQVVAGMSFDETSGPIIPFGAEHGSARSDESVMARWNLRKDCFVLTVSHLYRYKKIEKLIEAYRLIGDRARKIPLVVAGEPYDHRYASRLLELAAGSVGRIVFTGGLDAHSLGALMADCRIFAFSSEAENLPITLLEAMAAGCAIITNRSCSMPEVCGDAVSYADPATPVRYADKLLELTSDHQKRVAFRRAASERSLHFKWSDTAGRTLAILRKAAGGLS